MLITFFCEKCGAKLEIAADSAGTQNECPTCRTPLVVPRKRVEPGTTIGDFGLLNCWAKEGWGKSIWLSSGLWTGSSL